MENRKPLTPLPTFIGSFLLIASLPCLFLIANERTDDDRKAIVDRVRHDIKYLASDELEGRGVETKGIEVAADYIRSEYKKLGLKSGVEDGSYYQPFDVRISEQVDTENTSLVLTGPGGKEVRLELGSDFQPQKIGGPGEVSGSVVFAGYGIAADDKEYNDFADLDVEGKIVIVMGREPQQANEDSVFDGTDQTRHASLRSKLLAARSRKAAAVIFVNEPHTAPTADKDELMPAIPRRQRSRRIPTAHVKQAVVNNMLAQTPLTAGDQKLSDLASIEKAIDENMQPVSQAMEGWTAELQSAFQPKNVSTPNVIGVIEGEGPHADETIVIGAHYDHLGFGGFGSRAPGRNEIHNGADDNATGTAAVLELARRFAKAGKKPSRRLVFVCFSGEERGLIGSVYYVNNPIIPLEKTVAMVNFDMIGRLRDNKLQVMGAYTGKGLPEIAEKAGEGMGFDLQVTQGGFGGSDHLPFSQRQIPAVFVHTGLHNLYHTPEDDFETINVEGTVKVIDYSERLISGLLELSQAPEFVSQRRPRRGGGGGGGATRAPAPFLGVQLEAAGEGSGIVVNEVVEDSPAAKAGLKKGDIIVKMDDKEIKTQRDITRKLSGSKAGNTVKLVLKRGSESVHTDVTLGEPRGE